MRTFSRPIVVIAALALLTACGGSNTPAAPAAPVATTATTAPAAAAPAAAAITDACTILSVDDVKAATGKTVTAAPGRAGRIGLSCAYQAAGDTVLQLEFTDSALFKEPKDALDVLGVTTGTSEPIDGLGDAAVFLRDDVVTDKLVVVKKGGAGTRSLGIEIKDDKPADTKDKAVTLAKTALGKI